MSEDITSTNVVPFPVDLRETIRGRVRQTIEMVLQEELEASLGASAGERTEQRAGYKVRVVFIEWLR